MITTITKLADFVDGTAFEDLPKNVAHETKRLLLDSLGCALAGVSADKGKWGINFTRKFFAGIPQATVLGIGDRMSAVGAAFANGELINALDYDAAGKHLPPFVIPACLAVAEMNRVNGKDFITACATALEVGMRVGLALGSYRDIKDEKTSMPPVTGHSSGVLGGAAGVAKLEGLSKDQVAQALSMAALISPVQTQTIMHRDLPTNSGKYLMAGWASQVGITAPYLIKAGHRGDIAVLDGDYGYWRFTGSTRWDPESVVNELGKEWRFLRTIPLKQYPCCRMMHGGLECLAAIIQTNKLMPEEIDGIHAYLEATCVEPMFNNPDVINQIDAQFSVAYNMSVLAFGIKPGARWQELNTMTNLEIRRLMGKVTFEPHPEYVKALKTDAHKRISKVEVFARGKIFVEERDYIKGTNTSNPATSIDDEELTAKFKDNASYILPSSKVSQACDLLMDLDNVKDVTDVIESLHL